MEGTGTLQTVLQIVTLAISLLSLIVTAYLTARMNKSNIYANVVLNQRMSDHNKIRDAFSDFCIQTSIHTIKSDKENKLHLVETYEKFRSLFKPEYEIDSAILIQAERIFNICILLYDGCDCHNEELEKERRSLDVEVHKYISAAWGCIKSQSRGTKMTNENFVSSYRKGE